MGLRCNLNNGGKVRQEGARTEYPGGDMTRLGPSRKRYAALRIVACLAITVIPGCAPYKYVQSRVTVLDAETGEPVRGAEVRLQYAGPPFTFDRRPRPETGTTDAHGVVVLPATIDRARMAWPA